MSGGCFHLTCTSQGGNYLSQGVKQFVRGVILSKTNLSMGVKNSHQPVPRGKIHTTVTVLGGVQESDPSQGCIVIYWNTCT